MLCLSLPFSHSAFFYLFYLFVIEFLFTYVVVWLHLLVDRRIKLYYTVMCSNKTSSGGSNMSTRSVSVISVTYDWLHRTSILPVIAFSGSKKALILVPIVGANTPQTTIYFYLRFTYIFILMPFVFLITIC